MRIYFSRNRFLDSYRRKLRETKKYWFRLAYTKQYKRYYANLNIEKNGCSFALFLFQLLIWALNLVVTFVRPKFSVLYDYMCGLF